MAGPKPTSTSARSQAADARFNPLYEKYLRETLEALAADREALKTGERLFVNYCTGCHGSDAARRARLPQPARPRLAVGRGTGDDQGLDPERAQRRDAAVGRGARTGGRVECR